MSYTDFQEEEYTSTFKFNLWRKVFGYAKPYKNYLFFLIFVMISVAAIDAIFPLMTRSAIDNYITPGNIDGLYKFAILYMTLVVVQTINVWLLIALAGKLDMWMCYDIRRTGFDKLQSLSFSYYDRTPVGWIMARMTSDSERLGDTFAWGFVDLVWGITMMITISCIMIVMNWKLALIILCTVPVLILISGKFQTIILKSYRKVRTTNSKITGAFNEGIMGAKTTKTLVRENENLSDFKILTGDMFRSSFIAAVQSSLYLPVVILIGSIGSALALWIGGNGVISGFLTYGTLVAFIAYTVRFFEPVQQLARIFAEFQNAQASAERIFSMLDIEPEIKDSLEVIEKMKVFENSTNDNISDNIFPKIKGEIDFIDVSFSYKKGEKVLKNFNLKVKAGQSIAFVGETGSGKTTIVNLICRFYEPTSGEILIDGVDYRKRSIHWLQSNIGVMLQTPHLFSGTISENIKYGKLDASDEEVIKIAKLVNAHDFIMKMENGYETEVGESGSLISVGQKQLISFARAILADPKIFILDEATSSVDTETEKIIQRAVEKVLHGRTSFVIAHRLSTIRSADKILVIEKGKIKEEGSHHELIQNKGHYYRLYTNQFMEERETEILST